MTDNEFCNELHKRAEEYFLNCQREYAIEELEKIKAEIELLRYGSDTYKYAIDDVLEILDNHISELKGEIK